jgi:hypothetical protein
MRAPTRGELSEALSAESGQAAGPTTAADAFSVDPDLDVAESSPGMISSAALRRARELVGDRNDTGPVPLARAFGRVVTAPKSWLVPEPPDERDAASLAAGAADAGLRVHGMARLAWCRPTETVALAFVNGQAYAASTTQLDVFRTLCRERMLRPAQLAEAIDGGNDAEWFRCLIAAGAFDVSDVS